MTILATIVVLGVLIFVHELGHFFAARSVGIRVERFSIGLGPRVWGYRSGDTEYVLSAIPLGGYVKMAGMEDDVLEAIEGGAAEEADDASDEPSEPRRTRRSSDFDSKPVWARAWVISAGVLMNMVFAFVAYTVVAAGWGTAYADTTRVAHVAAERLPAEARALADVPVGAHIVRVGDREVTHWGEVLQAFSETSEESVTVVFEDPAGEVVIDAPKAEGGRRALWAAMTPWTEPELGFVQPGTPADRAGLEPGDRILAVDGRSVQVWSEIQRLIQERPDREITLSIRRDGGELQRALTPEPATIVGQDGQERTVGQIGVQPAPSGSAYLRVPPIEAVQAGWDNTAFVTGFILNFLKELVTGQVSARNLGSIVTIGEASGQAAEEGIPVFLGFMALFSVNLAILNLLPIPVLDGGHLVFLAIEAVRGRPVSVEQRLRWSQVGFVILIGIMALALGNDFLRLFGI